MKNVKETYPFLVNDSTVLFDNALRFRKNLVKNLFNCKYKKCL